MKRISTLVTAAAAALVLSSTGTAHAAVSVDDWQAGTGFVGKGDVQTAYGWNNKQLQQEQDDLGFWTLDVREYSAKCGPSWLRYKVERTTALADVLSYESRKGGKAGSGQVNGFLLTGERASIGTDKPACLVGTITDVQELSHTRTLHSYRTSESGSLLTLPLLGSNRVLATWSSADDEHLV